MTVIAGDFFDVDQAWPFAKYFQVDENPLLWLGRISAALLAVGKELGNPRRDIPIGCHIGENVFIHESVALPQVCAIDGPAYLGRGTRVRPFAYIRENVIVGENCTIGHGCELKNSLLLNGVQLAHFNYVGDSILGNFAHLGAGAIIANLRLDRGPITLRHGGEKIMTGLVKVGAIVGDHSEIACNVVLNPGTVLPRGSKVFLEKRRDFDRY
jgi:NDP-sugar pyrophosphorylase family protein